MTAAIDRILASARARIGPRVQPDQLADVMASGVLIVDIRPVEQRLRDGDLPGSLQVDRNVLEWRLDPSGADHMSLADAPKQIVGVCNEGYQSSLAAASLRDLGLRATDVVGGFQAWRG